MRIEAHLNCFGYFGFGGGWEIVSSGREPDGKLIYCNLCPLKEDCWERHRQRVREFFPDACGEFERMLDECDGDANQAMRMYSSAYSTVPPDIVVQVGNLEDGSRVDSGAGPADRGPYSITFPFPVATQI